MAYKAKYCPGEEFTISPPYLIYLRYKTCAKSPIPAEKSICCLKPSVAFPRIFLVGENWVLGIARMAYVVAAPPAVC